jgi:p-aminobenzoyl-glutamate transporter AbgT
MFIAHKLFKAAFLAMVLVNILLTILIGLDMAKRARFNGLWIAIVLVTGLPGSAVYALFRIGDSIAEVKKN